MKVRKVARPWAIEYSLSSPLSEKKTAANAASPAPACSARTRNACTPWRPLDREERHYRYLCSQEYLKICAVAPSSASWTTPKRDQAPRQAATDLLWEVRRSAASSTGQVSALRE